MPATAGVNFGDLTAQLVRLAGVSTATAHARINQAYRTAVAEAECLIERVTIGTTTAGTNIYDLDAGIVRLLSLRVDGRGAYDRVDVDDIDDLNSNDAWAVGYPARFFAAEYSSSGGGQLLISPTPVQSGLAITGRAAVYPADMTSDAEYPKIPPHFHTRLVNPGALAVTFAEDDERLAEADALEAKFRDDIRKIRAFTKKRVGSGVARVSLRMR